MQGELELECPGAEALLDLQQPLEESLAAGRGDGRQRHDQTGCLQPSREGGDGLEHRRVQRRLAHARELDLELFAGDNAVGEALSDRVVNLEFDFFPAQFSLIRPPGIAHAAGKGTAEKAGDDQHPFFLPGQGRLQ